MKRVWFSSLLCFVAVVLIDLVMTQDLGSLVPEMGGTLCMYLAMRSQISRKFFNTCGLPTCHWDSWNDALNFDSKKAKRERIVLSFAHNGFGNQLWEHSVAFMVAESLKARLLIAIIPDSLSPNGYLPPNTWTGFNAMERLLPSEFVYENLPSDSPVRTICDKEEFYVSDRPIDWRNQNYSRNFKSQMYDLLNDEKPRCLRMVGYFQNLPLCADDARRLWTPKLFSNFTSRPGDNDISIYLRCLPRHYHFNDRHFYEAILNHTTHDRVWLFQAPECPTKLSSNPAKDGIVASVVRLLTERFNATRWPSYSGTDDTAILLHDLAGLASSKKLILPVSSWAHWGGLFSNATEIHVNAPPHHAVMYGETRYVYHSDKSRQYFGKYNNVTNDIEFGLDYNGKTGQVWKRDEKIMSQFVASTSANVSAHSSTATSPDIEGSLKVANLSHSKSMTASTATQNSTIDVEKEEAGNHTTFPVYLTFP